MPRPNETLFRYLLTLIEPFSAGITEENCRIQPAAGINHPLWIMGHEAVALDFAMPLIGQQMQTPKDWMKAFGPNSKLAEVPTGLATFQEVKEKTLAIGTLILKELPNISDEALAAPRKGFLEKEMPCVGDALTHLMTSHFMLHLGQLSVWRRLMNLPSVINI